MILESRHEKTAHVNEMSENGEIEEVRTKSEKGQNRKVRIGKSEKLQLVEREVASRIADRPSRPALTKLEFF
jgi:hypothetical protein